MVKGLYAAYTGMVNQQNRMDVITNNLANADTNAYKKEGATSQAFDDVLAFKLKDNSEASRLPKKIGINNPGVKVGECYTDYSQGSLRETGNAYDLALTDSGFFAIEFKNKADEISTKYSRDGNFTVNSDGNLVTQDGDYVLDKKGKHIKVDPLARTEIGHNGEIVQNGRTVATIGITDFEDYDYLEKYGENMYQPVEDAKEIPAKANIYQGYLEMSNINVASEMVNMITIQRAYESNQKMITTIDGTLDITANQLGKI